MQDEVEVKARDWSGMDGATAWHLIDRHANNWTEVGEMMNAWLASNSSAALRQRPVVDDAMVEAVWNALDPGDIPGLTRRKLRAALLAAYQQDNGGK
jgi:type II secretory pathway predicted ATPase ExeA